MRVHLALLLGVLVADTVEAYEIDTHSRITLEAFRQSRFVTTDISTRLGLTKSRKRIVEPGDQPKVRFHLGPKYYDPVKTNGPDRYATDYDALNSWVMKQYKAPQPQRRWTFSAFDGRDEPYFPVDWMARGAVREDDGKWLLSRIDRWKGELNIDQSQDANPQLNRFCNHFYDPVADKALDLGLSPLALPGARDAMWRALDGIRSKEWQA